MKRVLYLLIGLLSSAAIAAQMDLSEEARISILTASPSDEAVFTLYGHTAIRINDPAQKMDLVFNYGIFDFSKPNFNYRFAKGDTDYKLGYSDFLSYIIEYQMRGSEVTEQVLNLSQDGKEQLWKALQTNYEPQNRVYRYNFFFDNCATRPVELIEKTVVGQIVYPKQARQKTFRDLINHCTRNHPWLTFGCDLALGSPTDRLVSDKEIMFLPAYLKEEFAKATIKNPDGSTRPLVSSTSILSEGEKDNESAPIGWFTPLICAWLLFSLIVVCCIIEFKSKKMFVWLDAVLFTLAGVAGIVLFFLCFISTHLSIWPNWSIIWLHPLHLLAVPLVLFKRLRGKANLYHWANMCVLTLLLAGWYFIPQHMNTAFVPLILILWLRSASWTCQTDNRYHRHASLRHFVNSK